MVCRRIVDMVLGLFKRERSLEDIKEWLEKIKPEGSYRIQNGVLYMKREGFATAISKSVDPVNNFVCLASFLIDPMFWVFVCRDGLKMVSKEWSNTVRKRKSFV